MFFYYFIVCEFVFIIDCELFKEVFDAYIFTESYSLGIKLKAYACLGEIGGQIEHLELELFEHIVAEIEDPSLHPQRRILVIKMISVIGSALRVMYFDEKIVIEVDEK